jgi:5-methylcytosine-specific restriction protein A
MTREEQLHKAMIDLYQKAGKATGYWANYYLRSVKKHGGLQTARKMLSKKAESQTGLQAVIDVGRPDLTVEHLVLQPQFSSLFTENELAEAKRRLSLVPQHAYRHAVPPENNHADEIADPSDFSEGAVKKVVVNAFERDLEHARNV